MALVSIERGLALRCIGREHSRSFIIDIILSVDYYSGPSRRSLVIVNVRYTMTAFALCRVNISESLEGKYRWTTELLGNMEKTGTRASTVVIRKEA